MGVTWENGGMYRVTVHLEFFASAFINIFRLSAFRGFLHLDFFQCKVSPKTHGVTEATERQRICHSSFTPLDWCGNLMKKRHSMFFHLETLID